MQTNLVRHLCVQAPTVLLLAVATLPALVLLPAAPTVPTAAVRHGQPQDPQIADLVMAQMVTPHRGTLTPMHPAPAVAVATVPVEQVAPPTPTGQVETLAYTLQFRWIAGYSVQNGWLCDQQANWLHCTQHWYGSPGHYVSLNPGWVPSQGSAPSGAPAVTTSAVHLAAPSAPQAPAASGGVLPGDFCPGEARTIPSDVHLWMVPAGCMSGVFYPNPADYYHPSVSWGQCSWWPSALKHVAYPGALPVHGTPVVGAIVYWPPYDNGGTFAHFGIVEAVGNGWLLTSEMNMYWRGGGFGKVVFVYRPILAGMLFYY